MKAAAGARNEKRDDKEIGKVKIQVKARNNLNISGKKNVKAVEGKTRRTNSVTKRHQTQKEFSSVKPFLLILHPFRGKHILTDVIHSYDDRNFVSNIDRFEWIDRFEKWNATPHDVHLAINLSLD